MSGMQFLALGAIWLAMAAWAGAISLQWLNRPARGCWTLALAAYLVHIAAAFDGFYHWSLGTALEHTASQTEALTGRASGAGLWVNFAFAGLLLADLAVRLARPAAIRPAWNRILEGIVLFMIVNGAVVFASGPVRWFGIVLLAGLAVVFWHARFRCHRSGP